MGSSYTSISYNTVVNYPSDIFRWILYNDNGFISIMYNLLFEERAFFNLSTRRTIYIKKRIGVNMDLYDENGNKIGFYAICNWWFESYPEDIFVKEPAEVIQIRELMKSLVKKSKVGINTKVKKLLKSRLCQDCEIGDDKGWSDLCPINCKYRKRKKVVKMTYSQHQKDILKSKNEI